MKAMILAAGLGTRMRPLTDELPKPLLPVGNSTLIELHLEKLFKAGIRDVVINVSYLAEKIQQHLGDGSRYGLKLHYSPEKEPLETAGGIQNALNLLRSGEQDENFLLINGDVWSDFQLKSLLERDLKEQELAHLILVKNPEHNLNGDFSLATDGRLKDRSGETFTFSGISLLSTALFSKELNSNKLGDLFRQLIHEQKKNAQMYITAQIHSGQWIDVGTPERLAALNTLLAR